MGLFDSALNALGLSPDLSGVAQGAAFNPVNLQTGSGGVSYDDQSRTFSSQLSPQLQALQQSLFGQLQGVQGQSPTDPNQTLALLRQQAQPYEQQQQLDLESRLFSQGRLGHSAVDRPGGARRSLFESIQQADIGRQLAAQQLFEQQRSGNLQQQLGLFGQLQGLGNMEQGLLSQTAGLSGQAQQSQQFQSNLLAQQEMQTANLMGNLLGSGIMAYTMGGTS